MTLEKAADSTRVVENSRSRTELLARIAQRNGALVILVVLGIVMAVTFPSFATAGNLSQIAIQSSFYAPLALGMTFVIFTGGIDLSVGSVYALGGVLAAWGSQYGFAAAILLPLVGCGLIGLIQGAIIARTAIPAFIVTLAGLLFARGLLLILTNEGATTYKVPAESAFLELSRGTFLGLGWPVWITVALFALGVLVLRRTSYGSTLLAIGGQEDAAELMGLPVARSKIIVYTVSGLLAGLAGALTASYTASGVTTLGVGLELTAISAVVLGGTLLTGGAGTVVGSLVGIVLLQLVANLINRLGLTNSNWQAVVNGVVLVVVAVAQVQLSRIQARSRSGDS
jgi:ribose transport system permease protein